MTYPDDHCVTVLRSTVATLLSHEAPPQELIDSIIQALYSIQDASGQGDYIRVAAESGSIASMALMLQLLAMGRIPPRAKA